MEKPRITLSPSPRKGNIDDSLDDFVFLYKDGDLDVEYTEIVPAKSPVKVAVENLLAQGVIMALTSVVSKENLVVSGLAKSVLAGAATTLTASGSLPGMALGALIAGGLIAYNGYKKRSVSDVIRSLSPQQQKQLVSRLGTGLKNYGITDMASEIIKRNDVKDAALSILSKYLTEKFNVRVSRA